jgi:V/A-type H+-transporting ATPase subunit K
MRRVETWVKLAGVAVFAAAVIVLIPLVLFAQQTAAHAGAASPEVMKWGFIAAAVSVGISTIAGGIAVGMVGSAAMGVVGERPEVAPRALIFVGLAEGIAIYGLIVSVMILGKL